MPATRVIEQELRPRAAHHERHRRDEQVHEAGAQVRLGHDAQKRHKHDAERLAVLARIVKPAAVARHDARVEQDDGDLGEFARLHLNAQLDPRLRAHARIGSEAGDVGREV